MFSHTVKGQEYNMPLLSRFLAGGDKYADPHLTGDGFFPQLEARLIDYELLTGADGKRTVAFGWHAGGLQILGTEFRLRFIPCMLLVAGTLEALVAMSQKHLERGVASPFLVSNCLPCRCPGNNVGLPTVHSPTTYLVKSRISSR